MVKEFVTDVAESESDDEGIQFTLDGRELRAFSPTDCQVAVTMAAFGRHTTDTQKIAGAIDFLVAVLDEDSQQYMTERLLSRTDPLDLEKIQEIIEWLVE